MPCGCEEATGSSYGAHCDARPQLPAGGAVASALPNTAEARVGHASRTAGSETLCYICQHIYQHADDHANTYINTLVLTPKHKSTNWCLRQHIYICANTFMPTCGYSCQNMYSNKMVHIYANTLIHAKTFHICEQFNDKNKNCVIY